MPWMMKQQPRIRNHRHVFFTFPLSGLIAMVTACCFAFSSAISFFNAYSVRRVVQFPSRMLFDKHLRSHQKARQGQGVETILIGHACYFVRPEIPVNTHTLRLQIGSAFDFPRYRFFPCCQFWYWEAGSGTSIVALA